MGFIAFIFIVTLIALLIILYFSNCHCFHEWKTIDTRQNKVEVPGLGGTSTTYVESTEYTQQCTKCGEIRTKVITHKF